MRTWLRRTALGFVGTGTFALSLLCGAILHLELPVARRAAASGTKLAFAGLPAKTTELQVGSIERSWGAVALHDVDATFTDEAGRPALTVRGASAKVRWIDLARTFVASGDVALVLEDVHVRSADVSLDDDGETIPRVGRAFFDPITPAPSVAQSPSDPTSGRFTLLLEGAVIDHVWAHGALADTPFDADIDRFRGSLRLDDGVRVRVEDAELTARGLPRPTRARVQGLVVVRPDVDVELAALARGRFGEATVDTVARGSVARLDGIALATQDGGTVATIASVWLPVGEVPLHAKVSARADHVPLRVATPEAPEGDVSADAFATLELDSVLEARGWVHSRPTMLAGQPVPDVSAKFTGRGTAWSADVRAHDDGLDVGGGVALDETRVAADLVATLRDLGRIGAYATTPAHGSARARVVAHGDLDAKTAVASVTASAWGASIGPARADGAELVGHVRWAGDHGDGDAVAVLRRGDARLDVDARSLHFGADGIAATGTVRTARGFADAEFRSSQTGTRTKAMIAGIRARDLAPFLTTATPVDEGTLDGTLDLQTTGGVTHGVVHARVDGVAATFGDQRIEGATAVLDAKLDDHDAAFFASVILEGEAAVTAASEHVHVPRLAFDRDALLAITGRAQVDGTATFACLHAWFGDGVPSTLGNAEAHVVYEHYAPGTLHLASIEVGSTGATFTTPIGPVAGIDARISGVVSLDDGHADLGAELRDREGPLAVARISTALDAALWEPTALTDLDRWKRTPALVHLEVPERDVSTLPSFVRPTDLQGRLAATVDLHGTALAPQLAFTIDEIGGRATSRRSEPPVDLQVAGAYEGSALTATIASRGARAAALDGQVKLLLPWADVLAGRAADVWEASGTLRAEKLALGSITGWFTRTATSGTVTGIVSVEGLHRDASATVNLALDDVAIGRRPVGSGRIAALAARGRLAANLDLVQKGGRIDATVSGAGSWGAALAPSLDWVTGVDGYVRAKSFDLGFVRPFVRRWLPGFNATLDSAMALHLGSDLKQSWGAGTFTVSGGRAEVALLGDELRDVRVRVELAKSGAAKISDVEIYPATGRINADGDATFEGLDFRSARLHLRIPANAEIPLGLEGMPVGDLEGKIDVTLARARDALTIGVNVPSVRLVLAPALGRTVQDLEPDPHVHFGTRAANGTFTAVQVVAAPAPESSSFPFHVALTLGDDVWIKRQSDLDVRVAGSIAIDSDTTMRIGGALSVPEGTVEIQGRRFRVERALITFDGQPPADPIIQATARYDAPAGVKIFADYVGAVSTGRVFLRSEPAMPANEIVATLVFGSPTAQVGSSRGGSGNTALQAAAFAGGYATQGLNRALDDISPIDVTTRVDTTSSQNPRPELSVRITKQISATLGLNLGVTSPGQPPDRTLLQLEYQFLPQWRVRTTNGDKGSSILDFIWQYRY